MLPRPDPLDRAERAALHRLRDLIREQQRKQPSPAPAKPKTGSRKPKGGA